MAGLNDGGSPEAVSVALLRARGCELLGELLEGPHADGFFLLGLCSLLDVILRRPMADILAEMPLPAHIRDALLGSPNQARAVLDAVIAYERGAWAEAAAAAARADIAADLLATTYAETLGWARELSQSA
jgi:EAL and modified HD-GYP domain-containing signal transduction protein